MSRVDFGAFGPVAHAVNEGRALLWLAWDGEEIAAAAVTELHKTDQRKICVIVACGGSGRADWLPLISGIEKFAKAEGCRAMRIIGRRGWMRVLPDYRERAVVIEKDI